MCYFWTDPDRWLELHTERTDETGSLSDSEKANEHLSPNTKVIPSRKKVTFKKYALLSCHFAPERGGKQK